MSIEQTSQLISLILNSVLMTLLSAGLLGGAGLRQNGLCLQLQQVQKQYKRLTHQQNASEASEAMRAQERNQLKANLKKVRDRRQQLIGQYRWSYVGMLLLHGVLLMFSVSLLALALRSLFLFDALISAALILFTLGVAGLVAGIGCILIDIAQGTSNGDTLSYSLAKVLSQLSHRWQRRRSVPIGKSFTPLSLKPLSVAARFPREEATPTPPTKKLPNPYQKSDSPISD